MYGPGMDAMEALLVRFCVDCIMRFFALYKRYIRSVMDAMEALLVRFCVEFIMGFLCSHRSLTPQVQVHKVRPL